ncbi:hypothetical protein [Bacillus sp. AP8]|uniref:hypothetical protein n=1 Tax=Bacillus sp. AP8 TaxID=1513284 RepID=UPI00030D3DE1|nr:hypothetical protein [Bacillus sp. AP8]
MYDNQVKAVEKYLYQQILLLIYDDNKDKLFRQYAIDWIVEIIEKDVYQGTLTNHDFLDLLLDTSLQLNDQTIKKAFTMSLSDYYKITVESEISNSLKLEEIKKTIRENENDKEKIYSIKP